MENKYLDIMQESKNGNFIISVIVGAKFQNKWTKTCKSNWIRYCKKYGLGLAILHTKIPAKNQNIHWQKYFIGSELCKHRDVNKICYLDYDILISPLAADIFETVDPDSINLVSQEKSLPYYDKPKLIKRNIAHYRKEFINNDFPLNSSLLLDAKQTFETYGLTPFDNYACMGVFVYNHEKFQSQLTETALKFSGKENVLDSGDELIINHELQKNYPINWLGYEWQTLWIFEVVMKYSFLYADRFEYQDLNRKVIESCLLGCNFLHFAGSWEALAFESIEEPIAEKDYETFERLLTFRHENIEPKLRGRLERDMVGND